MSNRQASPITSIIVAIMFIVGGWMVYSNFTKAIVEKAEASKTWPNVKGEITFSGISESRSDGKRMYSPNLQYAYIVSGQKYNGNRLNFVDGSTSSRSSVEDDLAIYPRGAKVNVYYDPADAASAILIPGGGFFTKLIKYAPWGIMAIGALMILSAIKRIVFGIFG